MRKDYLPEMVLCDHLFYIKIADTIFKNYSDDNYNYKYYFINETC